MTLWFRTPHTPRPGWSLLNPNGAGLRIDLQQGAKPRDLEKHVDRMLPAAALRFTSGSEYLILKRRIKIPVLLRTIGRDNKVVVKSGEASCRKPGRVELFPLACLWLDRGERRFEGFWHFDNPHKLVLGDTRRFEGVPSTDLTYDKVLSLKPGDDLGQHFLRWGRSKELSELGYPSREDGINCLTEFDEAVIPLARPEDPAHWELPLFARVRGLRGCPRSAWAAMLRLLHGRRLESVTEVPSIHGAEEDGRHHAHQSSVLPADARTYACYEGESTSLHAAGYFLIFERRVAGMTFYILDTPADDRALRIYGELAHSVEYAKGDAHKHRAMEHLCLARIIHEGDWQSRVEDTLLRLAEERSLPAQEQEAAAC